MEISSINQITSFLFQVLSLIEIMVKKVIQTSFPFHQNTKKDMGNYLNFLRTGRKFTLDKKSREEVIEGLKSWEGVMEKKKFIDYLGLTNKLADYEEQILPKYDHIIVDEAQDFGTIELSIMKKLCKNDMGLFFCGDIAQGVLPKHRDFKKAGINLGNRK